VREHLLNKYWGLFSHIYTTDSKVIDIGCGEGTNAAYLLSNGVDCFGIDASRGLINSAKKRHQHLADRIMIGDAVDLPFNSDLFDSAMMIGVLHHISTQEDQIRAINEALRVVKPGAAVIIRECNLNNPLFRIFWNYIFPLTAKIDRFGGENWLKVKLFKNHYPLEFENVEYFTFIPNFIPPSWLNTAKKVEKILESSILKKYSAHYAVVLRKSIATD
jgi:ubiquinone/menaquinone biosynthesis C-methylase UbiE